MRTFRTYDESKIKCDRCGKEIPKNTGTEDEVNLTGYFLVPKKNVLFETHTCNEPDLCADCVESLNNWFSSDEYKRVESVWDIETDLPLMDKVINEMADHIIFLHKEYNELELEGGGYVELDQEATINRYFDTVKEDIRRTKELRELQI